MPELHEVKYGSAGESGDKDSGGAEEGNSESDDEYFDVLKGADDCQLLGLGDEAYTNIFAAAALSKDVQENPRSNLIDVELYNS
ncbi:hypothetical protein DXG03_004128, partial [Asterophora parasitica]